MGRLLENAHSVTHESTIEKLLNLLGITRTSSQKRNFCYCRVSSQNKVIKQSQYLTYILSTLLLRILVQESILQDSDTIFLRRCGCLQDTRFGFETHRNHH